MPVIAVIAIDRRAERAYFSSFGSSGFKTNVLHANNRTIFPQEVENSKPCSSLVVAYARERDFSSHAHSMPGWGKDSVRRRGDWGRKSTRGIPVSLACARLKPPLASFSTPVRLFRPWGARFYPSGCGGHKNSENVATFSEFLGRRKNLPSAPSSIGSTIIKFRQFHQ